MMQQFLENAQPPGSGGACGGPSPGQSPAAGPQLGETRPVGLSETRKARDAAAEADMWRAGPHMVHPHTVHLPLGALLTPCTMCGTGGGTSW